MNITLGEALKHIKNFIFGIHEENTNEISDNQNVICNKCGQVLRMYEQFFNDISVISVYKCDNCGSFKELQYNNRNELIKDINIYDPYPSTNSDYLEISSMLEYNQFSLLRLWIINGVLCFPVLMKTDISNNVTLLFVRVGTSLKHENIDCFLINENNIISEAIISNDNSYSYFFNPYLSRLPHPTLNIKANHTERSDGIDYASNIRYQHTIQTIQNRNVHKLRIIKDYPIQNYGIEIYVKFISHENNEEEPIRKIISKLDLKNIIIGSQNVNIDIDYSVQSSHVLKISYSTINKNSISEEQREKLYEDIKQFFGTI